MPIWLPLGLKILAKKAIGVNEKLKNSKIFYVARCPPLRIKVKVRAQVCAGVCKKLQRVSCKCIEVLIIKCVRVCYYYLEFDHFNDSV